MDFERHSFVAWNPRFLEHTGFSEDEMKSSKAEELLTFGESWFPLSDIKGQTVEYIACAAKRPFGADPAPGFAVRSHGKIGYVMLDIFDSSSAQFEQGRNVGHEEERNRIIKTFQQEVSSSMIAALFLIETAKSELEEAGLPQAEAVSNGIRHSRRNHRKNRACDWRSRPTFRINLTLETALSRRARSGWSPPTYLE